MRWQVQEAKQRFSEVLRAADQEPQIITKHGHEIAVVIDFAQYRRLRGESVSLMEYLRVAPHLDVEIDLERAHDAPRPIDLSD